MPISIVKPSWVVHPDETRKDLRPTTIYSVAIHPDKSRLATGGLDTKIRLWSTLAIVNEKAEMDERVPKLLATLTSHSGVVMCVRWSNDGRYLASGSDDKIVMIWSLEGGKGGKVWGTDQVNVENWKAVRRLVGHDSDVAGVAWSPNDEYVASVGLDSSVYVYSGLNFDRIARLDGHMGFVKGVVFDPVGKFLATQSDDGSAKIWRTTDWRLHASIEETFVLAPKTNINRPSWSPDGALLLLPNATSNEVFVAAIVERTNFRSNMSMVGHGNIVECSAFNPLIFLRDQNKPIDGANFCTLAALSARNTLSLWITSQSEPIVVFDEVFDRDILDLSWSKDGTQLWACSSEGHIAVFTFNLTEIAIAAPPGTKEKFYQEFYGVAPQLAQPQRATLTTQTLQARASGSVSSQVNTLVARKGPGAKRIVPRVVPVVGQQLATIQQAIPPQQPQQGFGEMNGFTSAFASAPTMQAPPAMNQMMFQPPQQMMQAGPSNSWPQQQQQQQALFANQGFGEAGASASIPRKRPADDSEVETIDPAAGYGSHPRLSNAPYRANGHTVGEKRNATKDIELRELRPAYAPTSRIADRQLTFRVTNQMEDEDEEQGLAVPAIVTYGEVEIEDSDSHDMLQWRNFGDGERKGQSEVYVIAEGKTIWIDYLPKYVVTACGSAQFSAVSTEDGALIVYSPTGRRLFPVLILDSPCSFLEAEGEYLLAITSLGSLTVWNTRTKKVHLPTMSISALVTSSSTRSMRFPTMTSSGLLPHGIPIISLSSGVTCSYDKDLGSWTRISETWWSKGSEFWDKRKTKAGQGAVKTIESAINEVVVEMQGREEEVSDDEGSEEEGDDEEGAEEEEAADEEEEPGEEEDEAKTMANDDEQADDETEQEREEGDKGEQKVEGGDVKSKAGDNERASPPRKKARTDDATQTKRTKKGKAKPEGEPQDPIGELVDFDLALTLAHGETRMAAAIALDSPTEYRSFLLAYTKKLAEEELLGKAEELIRELLGPIYYKPPSKDEEPSWIPTVLGFSKRDLLKDVVLNAFSKNKNTQPLASEYQEILKKINSA